MKNVFKIVVLSAAVLSLAACSCPRKDDYTAVPYADERTAGDGTVVYEGECHAGGDRSSFPVEEERTASGDDMFNDMQRK